MKKKNLADDCGCLRVAKIMTFPGDLFRLRLLEAQQGNCSGVALNARIKRALVKVTFVSGDDEHTAFLVSHYIVHHNVKAGWV